MNRGGAPALLIALLVCCGGAAAEPYLAVREGLKCLSCHVNPSGGGLRTAFGNAYAQTRLAAERIETGDEIWTGVLNKFLAIGGDFRGAASYTGVPRQKSQSAFETQEFRLYAAASVIPDRLALYLDQRVAPGGSSNQEAYARLSFGAGRYYLKAGQMYLPYGLRLEDDTAFIRQAPGINFTTPDNGLEFGLETQWWTAQLAVSNGSAGAAENNSGKQASLRVEQVRNRWRAGFSANFNQADRGDRNMQNLFVGLRTGPVVWLAEADHIDDDSLPSGRRRQWAGLLEANWTWRQGQNLKLTTEYFEPNDALDEDEQNRYSLVWEYTPIQFLQSRLGLRINDGIPQNDLQNRRTLFWGLHGFF
ncbi:MAG: hypothetical protein ACRETN_13490 [Nevskiales bacterium]